MSVEESVEHPHSHIPPNHIHCFGRAKHQWSSFLGLLLLAAACKLNIASCYLKTRSCHYCLGWSYLNKVVYGVLGNNSELASCKTLQLKIEEWQAQGI